MDISICYVKFITLFHIKLRKYFSLIQLNFKYVTIRVNSGIKLKISP